MATRFVKNQPVRLNAVVPQGIVAALRMDEDGNMFYLMEWDEGGQVVQRWFPENALVEVAE